MTASEGYMFVTSESICIAFANIFAEVAVVALIAIFFISGYMGFYYGH